MVKKIKCFPFLKAPFQKAIQAGIIKSDLNTISAHGEQCRYGELTYMNLVHLAGCDGTDPNSLTRFEMKGRKEAMQAIRAFVICSWML